MATRIRTLNFLPEIFKTETNAQFLAATLDQLVAQPNTKKVEGYIGSKFGYGVNANDYYVTEPTKTRVDYQLEPGVVFLKENQTTAKDFISYPGIIDALKLEGGITSDNNRLFNSQFYSWDSFTNLDSIINFNQYYWLPEGPERVIVSSDIVYNSSSYVVQDQATYYLISSDIDSVPASNPSLTLLRGGTYTFTVNQDTQFWIQGEPGVTGLSQTQHNVQTRDVYGVSNNGASQGVISFTVPEKNALDDQIFPGNNRVDILCTTPFSQVNGAFVKALGGIDGVSALDGLTVMFYNTGVPDEVGFVDKFYDQTLYDEAGGVPYVEATDYPGTSVFDNNYEGGFYSPVNSNFYTITLLGDIDNPFIQLTPYAPIPTEQRITVNYGTTWADRNFYRSTIGVITAEPYNSAILNTLYYQDGSSPTKVGIINIIDNNNTNQINIIDNILGKTNYTAPNGVVFTNGLKVLFQGNVFPESYNNQEYYVEGVGTAIELIAVTTLVSPGLFSEGEYIPFDTTSYDVGNYDSSLYIPIEPDYITIARNSINRNAWSRSNRWFHINAINASAEYNNNPSLITQYTQIDNKAKRPIIEFYPNLRLFDSGVVGKDPIDFIDTKTTDAFTYVAGQTNYYPDVAGWTTYNATIVPVTSPITTKTATATYGLVNQITLNNVIGIHVNDTIQFTSTTFGGIVLNTTYYITSITDNNITISTTKQGTNLTLTSATGTMSTSIYPYSTTITIPTVGVSGLFEVGQYVADSTGLLPSVTFITAVTTVGSNTNFTVSWDSRSTVLGTSVASIVSADTPLSNYALFNGSRVVFAADTDPAVRNKIYISHFSVVTPGNAPVITLTEATDGLVLVDEQTAVYRGYNYKGKDFYYNGEVWTEGQQKTTVNQPPKFDVFDKNNISFGDATVYVGTSFTGCTLFAYGIGSGINDSVLGFPLRYSSVDNVGDISFDVTLNSATFNYVEGTKSKTEKVNTGYVYNYTTSTSTGIASIREIGWQTAVSPSVQYQVFEFEYNALLGNNTFTCDIAPIVATPTKWPLIQVYINNNYLSSQYWNVSADSTGTSTVINIPTIDATQTVVQILILSDQVSQTAYYQTPINLNNNPLNQDLTTANIGDIRGQYQSIFFNNPYMTGEVFGPNNYHDLGNLVPWGNRIIQNSAALAATGTFLRNKAHDLFSAVLYNSRSYITFKALLVDTVNNTDYSRMLTPSQILDNALDQINAPHTTDQAFFWSDMLPSKAPYITNTYSFANSLDVSIYPLSKIYNFTTANYNGVLVYLTRSGTQTQLIKGVDYTISTDAPSLTVTLDLLPNDQITIKEYNQTYGSYVPNTPTKLGLYPSTIPKVVLDTAYSPATYFIVGHDGSFNKLYGTYDSTSDTLSDFRDQVLLEYETRVYNNLKLSETVPAGSYQGVVIPGFFRTTDYSYDEFLQIYSEAFLSWVGQNRITYKTQFYSKTNQFTYNYRGAGNKLNQEAIQQGYFRGLYLYYYDTSTPNETPWEMLGLSDQPSWWTARYGAAPYTSDNLVLWEDLAAGLVWNNGNSYIKPSYVRSGLLKIIPVDSAGNLIPPLEAVLGNYNQNIFQRDWIVGDVGPAEFSYRRSSTWPFDLMRILAVTKPADFFNLGIDVDNYKYNVEFNQYLVDDRSHLVLSNIPIYGNGTPATSYINWIVDYEKQVGVDATTNISTLLNNLDVRLVYRMAGFSDKNLLQFYVEKSSANSNNSSLLIPDESYGLLLYENQAYDTIVYSGVIIQVTENGYKVYGNSQTNAYFKTFVPKYGGATEKVTVENVSVSLTQTFYDVTEEIPYGTEFYSVQQLSQFLISYGEYLKSQGVLFDQIENGMPINWSQMVAEFLYWSQTGWEIGSITTINPAATLLAIDKESRVVQPLTLHQQNFILNQNLYPIQNTDLSIVRNGTLFTAQPLASGDAISYGQFNISNIEHAIVFDNTTLFNDIIYNLVTGLRQNRIYVRGTKTADWNGNVDAFGFILNQDNIVEWTKEIKYTKGSIVTYKNKYWFATDIIQAKEVFDERDWKQTDYNEIQKGLLPNSSTRSYESTLYYNVDKANLENDADLLSFSLIGYRPREYMSVADLTDITQVNVYKNLIKEKGTLNAANAFKGANLPQGGIDYDIYENWAIKSGEFGGVLNNNYVQFRLNQTELTGNPSIVGLTTGNFIDGVQQEVWLYNLFNYGTPITSPNILPTLDSATPSTLYPTAGYVNYDDVKMSSYYYSGLSTAQNSVGTTITIDQFYVRDYVWLANYLSTWQVYTPSSLGSVVSAKNNLNGTVTITFSQAHNLKRYQPFAIVNFNVAINNYYIVAAVVDSFNVIINLTLNPQITSLTGQGIGFKLQSQRVATAPEISTLPLIENEFNKLKVWVDTNNDGDWAVYRKSLNYQYNKEIVKSNSVDFGSAVAYTSSLGYMVGDSGAGKVYRYAYDNSTNGYVEKQTLSHDASFGSTITYIDDLFVISQPTGTPKVYVYKLITTTLVNELQLYQTIDAPSGATSWGTSTAMSGDQNWLYISDFNNDIVSPRNNVYVYRKSAITNLYEQISILTVAGLSAGDEFGYSIATDYYGDTVVIGAPYRDYDVNTQNYGYTYVFSRTVENLQAQSSSQAYIPLAFSLAWTPNTLSTTATSIYSNAITLGSVAGLKQGAEGTPIVFAGATFGGIATNTVYYVKTIVGSTITVSLTRNGTTLTLTNTVSGTMTATGQTFPLYVTVNGVALADNLYATVGSTFYVYSSATPTLTAGDIVNVSSTNFVLTQTLTNEQTPRVGVEFGTSVDTNTFANEILIGAPFELSAQNYEGAVHRYTNGGERYGTIIGTSDCNITAPIVSAGSFRIGENYTIVSLGTTTNTQWNTIAGTTGITYSSGSTFVCANIGTGLGDGSASYNRTILLNGYKVVLPAGDASTAATAINSIGVINVFASALDGKLVIALINVNLGVAGNKLSLSVLENATLGELGVTLYTQTQTINCPHLTGRTQFGTVVKFDKSNSGSFIASAPVGARYSATTFDFTDDELDNDTVFDNNATQWIDTFTNAGATYMFDYLSNYDENINATGKFVYAQSTNAQDLNYGSQPYYGTALDFNSNTVTIGTPNFSPTRSSPNTNGVVVTYVSTSSTPDWTVYRQSAPVVDINGVFNIQLFSASTNETLMNLDYIDPLQGKLLGAVAENIDIVSNADPASYNSIVNQSGLVWGADKIGTLWFDTSNTRFMNYHQNDVSYNSQYWGRVFPGSDVTVYSWVASNVIPSLYTGPGVPYNTDNYTVRGTVNAEGLITPIYYFWARNTNIVFDKLGKTLADSTLQLYIANPQATGISYFTPLLPNVFGLYNCIDYVNSKDTVLQLGYSITTSDDAAHSQYSLIRANYPEDFLPGVPGSGAAYQYHAAVGITEPIGLYNRMLDSMCGVDNAGGVVPDPLLPKAVQTGVLARPRQGFFYDRFGALKNYLQYANTILAQFPITEIRNIQLLNSENPEILDDNGNVIFAAGERYNTKKYWNLINWWAPGYNNNTKSSLQVPIYADLSTLNVSAGTIVTVALNGSGNSETYIYAADGTWVRIGLENGTIQFDSVLWDYPSAKLGFGDNFFDTTPFDEYPSTETRYIVRALNEEIYTNELLVFRNKSLILLFEYIQSETIESQNYLDWLNKTSFVDVSHTIRELVPLEVFRSDNQTFLEGYLNEVKPYHVVIKEFIFKYTKTDIFEGDITDFDLPSQFNNTIEQFVTPELVYANPSSAYQYLPSDLIWQTAPYSQWFNNYGLSIVGQPNYQIAILDSYMALNTTSCYVDNINGFPVTGTIKLGTEEISYTNRNLSTGQLNGLSRGINGTAITTHYPGENIYIDLPSVVILNEGRGYANPPRITAYIDTTIYPAPRTPAQFAPIMSLGSVIGVEVIYPGDGYAALPLILIDPAYVIDVDSSQVNPINNTIELYNPLLQTGDLVTYTVAQGSTAIEGLSIGQRYYVSLLESTPVPIFALYSNYLNAINDHDRIPLYTTGSGTQYFSQGAIASCVTSAAPVRENSISLKFDRTSYTSQVVPWTGGDYYGSFYAGTLSNSNQIASSSILLFSQQPPIASILASAEGEPFEILDVENQQSITWSSRTRNTVQTYGSTYATTAYQNAIRINPSEGGSPVAGNIGSTVGFYIGMPIKFVGSTTGTRLESSSPTNDKIYYIRTLVQLPNSELTMASELLIGSRYVIRTIGSGTNWNTIAGTTGIIYVSGDIVIVKATSTGTGLASIMEDTGFTISDSVDINGNPQDVYSPNFGSSSVNISAAGLTLYVGELTNLAVMTINYSGIRSATETNSSVNTITTLLTSTGQNGTNNFYTGLPIFFTGDVFGGIEQNQRYYVTTVIDNQTFTMSASDAAPTSSGITATSSINNAVTCDTALGLSVNDPVIFTGISLQAGYFIVGHTYTIATLNTDSGATTDFTAIGASSNTVGIVFTATGVGSGTGTATPSNPADTFGGIVAGQTYYVREIFTGNTSFSVATSVNGSTVVLTTAAGTGIFTSQKNIVQLVSGTGLMTLNVALPVSPGQINGQQFTLYETSTQYTNVSGQVSNLLTRYISATLGTLKRLCIPTAGLNLTNMYENMEFTLDKSIGGLATATPYTVTGFDTTSLTVSTTTSTDNWLILNTSINPDSTNVLYVGMPITFSGTSLGGVSLGVVYYVYSIDASPPSGQGRFKISQYVNLSSVFTLTAGNGTMVGTGDPYITISNSLLNSSQPASSITVADPAVVTVSNGAAFPNGTAIKFTTTGTLPTPLTTELTYYVRNRSGNTFNISYTPTSSLIKTTVAGTGTFNVIESEVVLTQYINPSNYAEFDVSYVLGGYSSAITTAGSGYAINNVITIHGGSIGGTNGVNDLSITVSMIDGVIPNGDVSPPISNGGIISAISSGTPAGAVDQYYLKVISENQVGVYDNPNLTTAVSGQNFSYNGVASTAVTEVTESPVNELTVIDSSKFNINDPVVFTNVVTATAIRAGQTYQILTLGTTDFTLVGAITNTVGRVFVATATGSGTGTAIATVYGGIRAGETYYIKDKSSTTVKISTTIDGDVFEIAADDIGSMTMAKAGDYALLPEPFFFNPSVVKYNNALYQCVVSNNDADFIFGKWELLTSSSRQINALDRIVGYYQPTVNMPGLDLTQLVTGITYPNSTYLANAFAPAEEYTLDTILQDQPFYAAGLNLKGIVWDGAKYLSVSDAGTYSSYNTSITGGNWAINNISNQALGITDLIYAGEKYIITTTNNATPMLISDNGYDWITNGTFTPYDSIPYDTGNFDVSLLNVSSLSLHGAAYNNGLYVAVGQDIITSIDLYSWTERYAFTNGLINSFNGVAYVNTTGYSGFIAVGLGQKIVNGVAVNTAIIFNSTTGLVWQQVAFNSSSRGFNAIASNGQTIVAVGDNGIIYTSFNSITWFAQTSTTSYNLNNVYWDSINSIFVVVGNHGTILTSNINGITWTNHSNSSVTTSDLTSVAYNNIDGQYIAVGYDNAVLSSTNASTWVSIGTFKTTESVYTVQGDSFTAGYGPEELVPGVVTDSLTMVVATRPGTNWDDTIYQHVGYNVVSTEIAPTSGSQTSYSFANLVTTPAQLAVFVIHYNNDLSTSLYEGTDYTVDWVNNYVTLTTSLNFITPGTDTLRIDVYEVGNGDQLVKASTKTDPIRINATTGFQEIYLNANYSAGVFQGSGIMRPNTSPIYVNAIATDALTNTIECASVNQFILNSPITFSGAVFGGIVEDQVYYVKSVGGISNRITISASYNIGTGTAGETLSLTTATGIMEVVIKVGTGSVWTPPAVYHNGSPLVLGTTAPITRTRSSTNTITTISTGGMIPNTPIVFSDTVFGGVLTPDTIYYVKTIYDANEFTISASVDAYGNAGPILELTDATGGATFITNDFAIGLTSNGIDAALIFAADYDETVDYISYTFMGETLPIQYGYTIPQVQTFTGNGSAASFALTNYIGADNVTNAIVEIDGLRQNITSYAIDTDTNTIVFTPPPPNGSTVAITSYNLTDRQYFNTQYNITGSGALSSITVTKTTNALSGFDQNTPTVATYDENSPAVVLFDQVLNYLTTTNTGTLTVDYPITFNSPTLGGLVAGQTYFVTEILNSTDFQISAQVGGSPVVVTTDSGTSIIAGNFIIGNKYKIASLGTTTNTQWNTIAGTTGVTYVVGSIFTAATVGTGTGTAFAIMTGIINGLTVSNITNINNAISTYTASVTVTGTIDAGDYVVCNDTTKLAPKQQIIFKAPVIDAASISSSKIYQIVTLGDTNWTAIGASSYPTVGEIFTASGAGTGSGTALLANVGGIITTGQVYFVGTIATGNNFTIVDQFDNIISLTTTTSTLVAYAWEPNNSPAVRVTTGINNRFTQNQLVRIDGVNGSTQLNNNVYYVHVITDTVFDLYLEPYNPALNAITYPVTFVSSYVSGGYVWIDELFTIADTSATATSSVGNRITAVSTATLISGTPVIFTKIDATSGANILGGILSKTTYYILDVNPEIDAGKFIVGNQYEITYLGTTNWNTAAGTSGVTYAVGDTFIAADLGTGTGIAKGLQEFTITENRYPNDIEVALTDATVAVGSVINVSQFEQVNVDRLWVTINGYRVPSSSLRLNPYNNLSILSAVNTGDVVVVTSMMPTATPNEEVYILNVSQTGAGNVYRTNTQARTWLVAPLSFTDTTIYLNDVSRITDSIVQNTPCPDEVSGSYNIGLISNKNVLCHVVVYNNNTQSLIDPSHFKLVVVDTAPILQITNPSSPVVTTGDLLTITSIEGRFVWLETGELIGFSECDLNNNTVSGLMRGAGGTGIQPYSPMYSECYGLTPKNRMTDVLYSSTWNPIPGVYNETEGDPLQIADTDGANFLRGDTN